MTAHAPIMLEDSDPWAAATREVNAWRGEAVHHYARAELAVSMTLETLASQPKGGTNVRLRRPLCQRFDALAAALLEVKTVKTQPAVNALAEFRSFQDVRTLLCHGAAKVALDRNGRWIVVLRLIDMRANSATRVARTFEECEAKEVLDELTRVASDLVSALRSVRDRMTAY